MGFLLKSTDQSARPWQGRGEIIDTKEQEQAVARLGVIRAHQGRMLVVTPPMEAE